MHICLQKSSVYLFLPDFDPHLFLKELLEGTDLELKKFFNTSGQSYRSLGLKDKLPTLSQDEAVKLLSSDGMLIKRPILIKDGKVLQVGYRSPYKDLNL